MFGKAMYYDKKTIDEYKAIIKGERQLEIEAYEVTNDKGAGIDIKAISADAKSSKKYTAKVQESILYDCFEFEKMLSDRDDYFDFTQTDDYDLTTVPRGSIIKIDAFIEIPDGFDKMQIIERFKPLLMESIDDKEMEQSSKEAIRAFFGGAKTTRIPVIIDADNNLLCAKMNQENLVSEYSDLEDMDEQITLLARVSSGLIKSAKPFYDPLKDFITMNRTMRRSMNDRGEELAPLTVERDYRQIDVLAIYR